MSRTSRPTAALGIILAAALAGATLSGCQTSSEASPSPTPTASPSPTITSPEDEAGAAAEEAVASFYSLTDTAMQDPESFDAENFKTVAISTALVDIQNTFNVYVTNELHRTGDIKVEELDVRSTDLDSDPPTVEVTACLDSSEVTVTNKDGETVEGQEGRRLMRLGVANYEYPDGPWQVAFTEAQDGETC